MPSANPRSRHVDPPAQARALEPGVRVWSLASQPAGQTLSRAGPGNYSPTRRASGH